MLVKKSRIGYDVNGKLELTLTVLEGKQTALSLEDKEYKVTFTSAKKRSLDANAYFHLLINKIAKIVKSSDDEVKKDMVLKYGTLWKEGDTVVGYKLLSKINPDTIYPYCKLIGEVEENGKHFNKWVLYKRTSELDSKEMSHLIDMVIEEAKLLGIETMTPNELLKMKGYGR